MVGSEALHLGVLGYRSFSDVRLLCQSTTTSMGNSPPSTTSSPPSTGTSPLLATPIHNNELVTLQGSDGDVINFIYEVEAGVSNVRVRTRKGRGDIHLYASFDRPNVIGGSRAVNQCVSKRKVNGQQCNFNSVGSTLYISVVGISDFSGFSLRIKAS